MKSYLESKIISLSLLFTTAALRNTQQQTEPHQRSIWYMYILSNESEESPPAKNILDWRAVHGVIRPPPSVYTKLPKHWMNGGVIMICSLAECTRFAANRVPFGAWPIDIKISDAMNWWIDLLARRVQLNPQHTYCYCCYTWNTFLVETTRGLLVVALKNRLNL